MFSHQLLPSFLALTSVVSALPNSLDALRSAGLKYRSTVPSNLADNFLDATSPAFTSKSARWSTFEAPTFDGVFIPTSEEELAEGVSDYPFQP